MYKLNIAGEVVYADTDATVPVSGGNPEWQTYLAWVAAGNTPAPYAEPVADTAARAARQQLAADRDAAKADARFQSLISRTSDQSRDWVDRNFPTLTAPERRDLATIVMAIGILARSL